MFRSLSLRLSLILILAVSFWTSAGFAENSAKNDADTANAQAAASDNRPKAAAVSSEYKVGESDVLQVTVWKEPDLSKSAVVRPDGMISLPLIGEVKVMGMTSGEIQEVVATKLKALVVNPRVTVEITEVRSRRVFITGEVVRPGLYPLGGPTTVLQLIAQAGGFTPFAKRKNIVILRQENGRQLKFPFNYPDVVRGRNAEENISLLAGDTVVVP